MHTRPAQLRQPARGRLRLRSSFAAALKRRAAPESRRHPGRRDARPRDHRDGDPRRRDRPPGDEHAAHPRRAGDDHPHHLRLPRASARSGRASSCASVIKRHHQPAARSRAPTAWAWCRRSRCWSSTALVREYIADKEKTRDLHDVIAQGHTTYGMQTFDQSLMALFREDLITYEEALAQCDQPRRLRAQGARHRLDQRRALGRVRQVGPRREWPGSGVQDRPLLVSTTRLRVDGPEAAMAAAVALSRALPRVRTSKSSAHLATSRHRRRPPPRRRSQALVASAATSTTSRSPNGAPRSSCCGGAAVA